MLEAHKFEQREENSTKKDRTAWSSAKDPVHCSWPCEPAGCWLTGAKRTTVVKNYRPISLIDVLCKLLSSVFANRINHHIEEIGLQEQAGFTPKRGCDDGTNTLKFTLQNLSAAEQEAYVLFVDLVKAFDSVNREMLWLILAKMGIPQSMINTIKKMYTGITINIGIGEAKEAFNSTSGVKQGDNLAPLLFIFTMQAVMEYMSTRWDFQQPNLVWFPDSKSGPTKFLTERPQNAFRIGTKLKHNNSLYADDAAFIFLYFKDIKNGAKLIKESFEKFGLQVHLGTRHNNKPDEKSKTEAMYFPPRSERLNKHKDGPPTAVLDYLPHDSFDIEGTNKFISFSPTFKYLGSNLTMDHADEFDIDSRITAATKAFGALKHVFNNRNISKTIRVQLYLAIPINILLWGCAGWAISAQGMKKLQTFHNNCARKLCGLTQYHHMTYHISMENIFNTRLNLLPIDKLVTIRQLRFLMKIANLPTTRLTRQIINSFAIPKAGTALAKGRYLSTRSSLREALEKVEIVTPGTGGPLKTWIPFLQRKDIGNYIEQKLELPEGTFSRPKKKKN